MANSQNVIYLPPGVAPTTSAPVQPPPTGVPFDRNFFENVLPPSVQAFCQQVACDTPIVELFTVDGTRHFVRGISGVADLFVALHTQQAEHDHPVQVFLPYQTIFRVEVHPEADVEQRRLGFINNVKAPAVTAAPPSLDGGKPAALDEKPED